MLAGGDVYAHPDLDADAKADQPYLHVFLEADSAPLADGGSGLVARVRFHARVQTLGEWLRWQFLSFVNAWKMS